MNITWNITKKRGNTRPVLTYTITLTDYEKSLCVPAIRVHSSIPKPPDTGWSYCWPNQNERGDWTPSEFYQLMTPSHRTNEATESVKLPWRSSNNYPEVEASFMTLRDAFEQALETASSSHPINESGSLETSCETKKVIAPAFAAERFLRAVGK